MSYGKPLQTSPANPCPICADDQGRCRHGDIGTMCMMVHGGTIAGYKSAPCKNPAWTIWIPQAEGDDSEAKERREQFKREAEAREVARLARLAQGMKPEERDRLYRQILGWLEIHPDDMADMKRRGMTDEQIERFGGRSVMRRQVLRHKVNPALPGVTTDGLSLTNAHPGLLCPVTNLRGQIVAFQLRLRGDVDGRYRWLSSADLGGYEPHMPIGEIPLGICLPKEPTPELRGTVGLCEGIGFKPFIAADSIGIPMIGASGGMFAQSPKILLGTLKALEAERIILYPDAGAIANPNILSQYSELMILAKESGVNFEIAWWGQRAKEDGDIDEPQSAGAIVFLNEAAFWSIAEQEALSILRQTCDDAGEAFLPERGAIAILRQAWRINQEAEADRLRMAIFCLTAKGRHSSVLAHWSAKGYTIETAPLKALRDLFEKLEKIGVLV